MISRLVVVLCALLVLGCGMRQETQTSLSVPVGATDLQQRSVFGGSAFQTDFALHAHFPASPARQHYFALVREPWVPCEWGPKETPEGWSSFLDGTVMPLVTVHQQLQVWINPQSKRMLLLAVRYYSSGRSFRNPDSDEQRVVLVEYFHQDLAQIVAQLNLSCPVSKNAP